MRGALPIVRRELVGLLRTRKAFWITVITVGASSIVPVFAWPSAGDPQSFARSFFTYFAYWQSLFVAFFLFVPVVSASAITGERERGTYELLFNTQVSPSAIVIGKLIASTAFFVLLLALTFPMVSILFPLGGLAIGDFITMAGFQLLFVGCLSLVGLWSSMRNERTVGAVINAFVFIFVAWCGLYCAMRLLFVSGLVTPASGPLARYLPWVLLTAIGVGLMASLLRGARFPEVRARRGLRFGRRRDGATAALRPPVRTGPTRILIQAADRSTGDWNPILVSSLRSNLFGAARTRRMLFWGLLALLVLVMCMTSVFGEPLAEVWVVGGLIILLAQTLILPAASAAAVTSERDLGNMDFLRGTLLTAGGIVRGKFMASLFGGSGIVFLGFAISLAAVLAGAEPRMMPYYTAGLISVTLVVSSSGILASTLSRTGVSALILSYVISMGYLLVLPMVASAFLPYPLSRAIQCLSPLTAFFHLEIGTRSYDGVFVLSWGLALCLAVLQVTLAARLFEKRWMRDR